MNPEPRQPVGKIEIILFSDGNVATKGQFPGGRLTMLGMLEEAKAQLIEHFEKKKESPGIAIAPPGLRFPN